MAEITRLVGVGTTGVAMAIKGMEADNKTELNGQRPLSRMMPRKTRAAKRFPRLNWAALIIPMIFGGPFLGVGLWEVHETGQKIKPMSAAQGTVVENIWRAFAQGGAAYVPVIEFQTQEGKRMRFTDSIGTVPPEYKVGARINILYDPKDVHNARVNSWKRIWFAPTLITSIGLVPVLIGVVLAWFLRPAESSSSGIIKPEHQ